MSIFIDTLAEMVESSVENAEATREDWERALDQVYGRKDTETAGPREVWPEGTRVVFSDEAKAAMAPAPGITRPLTTPGNGPDAVYTIKPTQDGLHDAILKETGERYGLFWLRKTPDSQETPQS